MNELPKVQTKTNTERSVLFFNSLAEINIISYDQPFDAIY